MTCKIPEGGPFEAGLSLFPEVQSRVQQELLSTQPCPDGGRGGGGQEFTASSLTHFDGTQGQTTATDEVPGVTWVFNNGGQISNANQQYGRGSAQMSNANANAVGTLTGSIGGDFTFEASFRLTSFSGFRFKLTDDAGNTVINLNSGLVDTSGTMTLDVYGEDHALIDTVNGSYSGLTANVWHTMSVERFGDTYYVYVNGVLIGSKEIVGGATDATKIVLNEHRGAGNSVFVDEVRTSVGARNKGANYTPTDTAFQTEEIDGITLEAETLTVIAAMTGTISNERKVVMNQFIKGMKDAGIWQTRDIIHWYAAHNQASSLINWKNPGTYDAEIVASPVFTANKHWAGAGTGALTPNVKWNALAHFTQSDASYEFRKETNVPSTVLGIGSTTAGAGETDLMVVRHSINACLYRINDDSTQNGPDTPGAALIQARRFTTAEKLWLKGVQIHSVVRNAFAPSDAVIQVLGAGSTYDSHKFSYFALGADMEDDTQAETYSDLVEAYRAAVGPDNLA